MQFLTRDLTPPPHDLEHRVQADHGPYFPSIGRTAIKGREKGVSLTSEETRSRMTVVQYSSEISAGCTGKTPVHFFLFSRYRVLKSAFFSSTEVQPMTFCRELVAWFKPKTVLLEFGRVAVDKGHHKFKLRKEVSCCHTDSISQLLSSRC